jgi:hypothetical protein
VLDSVRVFQQINDPKCVIANGAKRNEAIARTRRLRDCLVVPPRNDNWAFFYLEHSKTQQPADATSPEALICWICNCKVAIACCKSSALLMMSSCFVGITGNCSLWLLTLQDLQNILGGF